MREAGLASIATTAAADTVKTEPAPGSSAGKAAVAAATDTVKTEQAPVPSAGATADASAVTVKAEQAPLPSAAPAAPAASASPTVGLVPALPAPTTSEAAAAGVTGGRDSMCADGRTGGGAAGVVPGEAENVEMINGTRASGGTLQHAVGEGRGEGDTTGGGVVASSGSIGSGGVCTADGLGVLKKECSAEGAAAGVVKSGEHDAAAMKTGQHTDIAAASTVTTAAKVIKGEPVTTTTNAITGSISGDVGGQREQESDLEDNENDDPDDDEEDELDEDGFVKKASSAAALMRANSLGHRPEPMPLGQPESVHPAFAGRRTLPRHESPASGRAYGLWDPHAVHPCFFGHLRHEGEAPGAAGLAGWNGAGDGGAIDLALRVLRGLTEEQKASSRQAGTLEGRSCSLGWACLYFMFYSFPLFALCCFCVVIPCLFYTQRRLAVRVAAFIFPLLVG